MPSWDPSLDGATNPSSFATSSIGGSECSMVSCRLSSHTVTPSITIATATGRWTWSPTLTSHVTTSSTGSHTSLASSSTMSTSARSFSSSTKASGRPPSRSSTAAPTSSPGWAFGCGRWAQDLPWSTLPFPSSRQESCWRPLTGAGTRSSIPRNRTMNSCRASPSWTAPSTSSTRIPTSCITSIQEPTGRSIPSTWTSSGSSTLTAEDPSSARRTPSKSSACPWHAITMRWPTSLRTSRERKPATCSRIRRRSS
mmetsp:Transcript_7733/g.20902  ORF Transcript_7733/g.20902 Transcript_7733/m.20902 type:complete len:254 (-) Transcript_7733:311-1072(-)